MSDFRHELSHQIIREAIPEDPAHAMAFWCGAMSATLRHLLDPDSLADEVASRDQARMFIDEFNDWSARR